MSHTCSRNHISGTSSNTQRDSHTHNHAENTIATIHSTQQNTRSGTAESHQQGQQDITHDIIMAYQQSSNKKEAGPQQIAHKVTAQEQHTQHTKSGTTSDQQEHNTSGIKKHSQSLAHAHIRQTCTHTHTQHK